jgi:hypothetical protein
MDWIADHFPRTVAGYEIGLWALGYWAWTALTAPANTVPVARSADRRCRSMRHTGPSRPAGARWAQRAEMLDKVRRPMPQRSTTPRVLKRAA